MLQVGGVEDDDCAGVIPVLTATSCHLFGLKGLTAELPFYDDGRKRFVICLLVHWAPFMNCVKAGLCPDL